MRNKIQYLSLILFFLSGCSSIEPLIVPNSSSIKKIAVKKIIPYENYQNTDNSTLSTKNRFYIIDQIKINKITWHINQLNTNMKVSSWSTYPAPSYSLLFTDTEMKNLVIFIGENWIGGRNNIKGNASIKRHSFINEKQKKELFDLLGIK
jgi:hypothetical protein